MITQRSILWYFWYNNNNNNNNNNTINRQKRDGSGENDYDGRLPRGGRTGGGTWHDIREKR
jgi:hypothetical protein